MAKYIYNHIEETIIKISSILYFVAAALCYLASLLYFFGASIYLVILWIGVGSLDLFLGFYTLKKWRGKNNNCEKTDESEEDV